MLGGLLEVAFLEARSIAGSEGSGAVPAVLRPHLKLQRLSGRSLDALWSALDEDAFRGRVAVRVGDAADLGPTAVLVLERPEGWLEQVAALESAAEEERGRDSGASGERVLRRRVVALEARVRELRGEREAGAAEVARLREELRSERGRSAALAARVDELQGEAARLVEERTRVVRELKAVEERAARRTRELRDLERRLAGEGAAAEDEPPAEPAAAAPPAAARRPRRRPTRLRHGVIDGTRAAFEQLLGLPGVVVLVDGYNVAMARWPDLDPAVQRESLIAALGTTGARTGATFEVVFDGETAGRPHVQTPLPVRVRFTDEDTEADDVILELIGEFPPERPVVVISGDRRVQQGARSRGANVVDTVGLPPPLGNAR